MGGHGRRALERQLVALGVSGGVLWRHPTDGRTWPGGLQYRLIAPVDPNDLLEDDEVCDCLRCLAKETPLSTEPSGIA